MRKCCKTEPKIVTHYIKGVANRKHTFVRCPICRKGTRDRKFKDKAIEDWENGIVFEWQ